MIEARVVILRHGETEYNVQKRFSGVLDVPLTARGVEQAREAGESLQGMIFDHAYSSTLSRAFNTAVGVLDASGNAHLKKQDGAWCVIQDKDIIEYDAGIFTGVRTDDPRVSTFKRSFDQPTPGGESERIVAERVTRFFEEKIMPHVLRGENVLIACHSGIVRAFDVALGIVQAPPPGGSLPRSKVHNAMPVIHVFEDGKRVRSYPAAAHAAKRDIAP